MPRKRAAPKPEADRPQTPSRSANKRSSLALQTLGMEIARLTPAERAALPLAPELAEAMELLDRLTDHEGRRRQEQYIGRLMREADGEALQRAMARRQAANAASVARFHAAEAWRDRLLNAAGDDVPRLLDEFRRGLAQTAPADADADLRRALDAARTARARGDASPRAARALFRRLADALAASGEGAQ